MTEAELADAVEAGKRTVLNAIGRHLPAGLTGQIEDIAQETYLRYFLAFQAKPALTGDDLQRWLYVAARNEALKAARKVRRESLALWRRNESPGPEADKDVDESGNREVLSLHIAGMPEPFREATRLRVTGLKIAEIAARLGVSSGTVKSRLSRGKEWLVRSGKEAGYEKHE